MVEVAEATWVLYFFKSLLRVDSSMIQAFLVGMTAGVGLEDGGKGGACSVRLPTVMPYKVSIGRGNDRLWTTACVLSLLVYSASMSFRTQLLVLDDAIVDRDRLGNLMERKAASQKRSE